MHTAEMRQIRPSLSLRVGQLVEIRNAAEILETLDERGELDGLPFMPEMARYCGQQFAVAGVAHKVCDTVNRSGMYRMTDAVHLAGAGSRCDGSAHDGCQAACLLFWKTAWLKKVDTPTNSVIPLDNAQDAPRLLPLLVANSRKEPLADGAETHSCQATEMPRAAPEMLRLLEFGQYVQDLRSGNRRIGWVVRAFLVGIFNRVQGLSRRHLPRRLQFRDAMSWGFIRGSAEGATKTAITNLRPGDLVRIQVQGRNHAHPEQEPAQSRPRLRRRDGTILWTHCPRCPPGRSDNRRADRPDADHEVPMHRARGHRLRGRVQRELPPCHSAILA